MRIDAFNQISQLYQASKPKKVAKTGTSSLQDQYRISNKGQDYQVAKNALAKLPDVREDKVAELKAAMESGTYNVSSQEIADAMVSKFYEAIG